MIQADIINTIASGVVGWRQPTRTGSPTISAGNLASSSGLYFEDGSSLCTIQNIKAVVDDEAISDANLNTLLTNLSKAALNEVCSRVFDIDDHITTNLLFKHENKFSETLENATDFVGFEIEIPKSNHISHVLDAVILEFDAAEDVTILLFNSQNNAVIKSQAVTTVANSQKTTSVRWVLNDLQYGGKWYIGYLRGGLTGKAIRRNYQLASLQSPFPAKVHSIRVDDWNVNTMFNPEDIVYDSETWGMNLNISAFRDYTEIVRSNINRFATALQLQVCAKVVDMISNSVQSNRVERLSKANALLELNGNRYNPAFPEHQGIVGRLNKEIRRLRDTYVPRGMITVTL